MVIYKTINLLNGKFYVGKDVKNKKSYLGSGAVLKQAIKKYGKENFKKEIIEHCDSLTKLEQREIYWIGKLNAIQKGYNITEGGTGGDTWTNSDIEEHWNTERPPWNKGKRTPDEVRNKISKSRKGKMKGGNSTSFKSGKEHRYYGKKRDNEIYEKVVETRKKNGSYVGRGKFAPKSVIHIEDDKVFESIQEAADYYELTRDQVGYSCRKKTKNGKFRFNN